MIANPAAGSWAIRVVGTSVPTGPQTYGLTYSATPESHDGSACTTTSADFESGNDDLMALVNQPRSDVPAITHVDYSARVQTVREDVNPEYYAVIRAFEAQTGCPVVVNTSFNVRGEPIVCSPQDAYRCFMRTEMDLLVLEDCLLEKKKQTPLEDDESWRDEYELD